MAESEGKKKKYGRLIYRVVLIVLLSLFIGMSLYAVNARQLMHNAMPMPFGIGSSVVLSGSMEPTLSVNDLVFVRTQDEYHAGDVVVYQSGNSLVIHRILEIEGDHVITKGDANNIEDAPVPLSDVKGRMVFAVPFLGAVVHLLQTVPGALIVIALAVFLMNRSWSKERAEGDKELDQIKAEIRRLKEEGADLAPSTSEEKGESASKLD